MPARINKKAEHCLLSHFQGLKPTFISLTGTAVLVALLLHFQTFWQGKLHLVDYLVYPLLAVTALFAAQFNRSRVTIVCVIWALFLAGEHYTMPWSAWLKSNPQWLILAGGSLLMLLSMIKDRGILSSHGIVRVIFIGLCGALVFGWLYGLNHYHQTLAQTPVISTLLPYLPLAIPAGLISLLILWRSLSQNSLTLSALLSSFALWYAIHYGLLELPWSMAIALMATIYLLSVTIESYYLAYRDDLTGLPTRRALNQLALSLGRKYTVAMLDIDHFKKFNDTYGHDIGDQVLKLVAAKLAAVKGGGKVFRYGGEEFTVVFPGKTPEHAIEQLEALRQSIADYAMVVRQQQRSDKKSRKSQKPKDQKTVSVTVSIGVATRAPKQSFEQALKVADEALYRAKKKGRNNVSQ